MSILLNNTNPKALYKGASPIKKVFRGEDLIWKKSRLPDEYQEVEWIESDGNAYIQLSCTFDATDEIFATCAILDTISDKYVATPSVWNSSLSNRFSLFGNYNGYFACGFGAVSTSTTVYEPRTRMDGDIHSVHYDQKKFDVLDKNIVCDVTDIAYNGETTEIRLFYGYNSPSKSRIHEYWHKRNGLYTANVISCYIKSDGVIGMYDLAGSICPLTGTPFYINSGTGTFTKGADI